MTEMQVLSVLAHLLRVFATTAENRLLSPWIVFQVCLDVVEHIFRQNASHSLLISVEELVNVLMADSRPSTLYKVCCVDSRLQVVPQEPPDKIAAWQIFHKPCGSPQAVQVVFFTR